MNKKYLISGGAGFIGSHLAEKLLDEGHVVYIIDDLSTGCVDNIEHLKGNPDFHFVWKSITDEQTLRDLVDKVDTIYHLAAAVGVKLIIENPVHTLKTNIAGTERVLEYAALKRKKVFVASTSEVYGKSNKVPFKENDDMVMGPSIKNRWSYACSKAIDEFLALAYWQQFELPIVIPRFFNTVGPRQIRHYGMVLPTFIENAFRNQPIQVFGSGKQTRCFGYVKEVVEVLYRLDNTEECAGEIFNIGCPTAKSTILELAKKVKHITNSKSEIKIIPYDQAYGRGFEDMLKRVPCVDKLKKYIGYVPTCSLDRLIEITAKDIEQKIRK